MFACFTANMDLKTSVQLQRSKNVSKTLEAQASVNSVNSVNSNKGRKWEYE